MIELIIPDFILTSVLLHASIFRLGYTYLYIHKTFRRFYHLNSCFVHHLTMKYSFLTRTSVPHLTFLFIKSIISLSNGARIGC